MVHRIVKGVVPAYKIHELDDTPVEGTFLRARFAKSPRTRRLLLPCRKSTQVAERASAGQMERLARQVQ